MKRDHLKPGSSDAGFGDGVPPGDSGDDAPTTGFGNAELSPNAPVRSSFAPGDDSRNLCALREAMGRLPPALRVAIEMRNLSRRPFEELAEKLGRSTGEARSIWLQALVRLNEEMRGAVSQQGMATPHDDQ